MCCGESPLLPVENGVLQNRLERRGDHLCSRTTTVKRELEKRDGLAGTWVGNLLCRSRKEKKDLRERSRRRDGRTWDFRKLYWAIKRWDAGRCENKSKGPSDMQSRASSWRPVLQEEGCILGRGIWDGTCWAGRWVGGTGSRTVKDVRVPTSKGSADLCTPPLFFTCAKWLFLIQNVERGRKFTEKPEIRS